MHPETTLTAAAPFAPPPPSTQPGNAAAVISWQRPLSDGGAAITSFVVTPIEDGVVQPTQTFPADADHAQITNLVNGRKYGFTVAAVNAIGVGTPSRPTPEVTVGTPTAPRSVTARAEVGRATVSWAPPSSNNGTSVLAYLVTPLHHLAAVHTPYRVDGNTRSIVVPGLQPGTDYRFLVAAVNAVGTGPARVSAVATIR